MSSTMQSDWTIFFITVKMCKLNIADKNDDTSYDKLFDILIPYYVKHNSTSTDVVIDKFITMGRQNFDKIIN